jgi:hypothetical protein
MNLTVLQFSFRLHVSRVSLQRETLEISNPQICCKHWAADCLDSDSLCDLTLILQHKRLEKKQLFCSSYFQVYCRVCFRQIVKNTAKPLERHKVFLRNSAE